MFYRTMPENLGKRTDLLKFAFLNILLSLNLKAKVMADSILVTFLMADLVWIISKRN